MGVLGDHREAESSEGAMVLAQLDARLQLQAIEVVVCHSPRRVDEQPANP
jgi:hypothetical protein